MGQNPIQISPCILSSFVFRFLPDNCRMSISGWAGELNGWHSRIIWEDPKDKWPRNARWDPRWLRKESTCQAGDAGDVGSIPGSGRSPGRGNGSPLQYSCLENPMDRGTWWVMVHGSQRVRYDLATRPPPPGLGKHYSLQPPLALRGSTRTLRSPQFSSLLTATFSGYHSPQTLCFA